MGVNGWDGGEGSLAAASAPQPAAANTHAGAATPSSINYIMYKLM